ncbi:Ig-like domain-containing protein [Spirillospora sp. NPDC052269]
MLRIATVGVTSTLLLGTLAAVPAFAEDGTATITIAAAPASVDPEHPTATLTGKVTGADGLPVAAGTAVELSAPAGQGDVTGGTTDADGNYTATLSPNGTSDSVPVEASVPSLNLKSESVTVSIDRGQTNTVMSADKSILDEGQALTLSGAVTYKGAAVAGGTAVIGQTPDGSCTGTPMSPVTLTVGADGKFSTSVKPHCAGTFYVDTAPAGLFKGGRVALGHTNVRYSGNLAFSATMDAYGQVTAWTNLKSASGGGQVYDRKVILEYSSNGTSGWKNMKTFSGWGTGYKATLSVYYSGYWRARFLGDSGYAPAVSPTKKLWRWSTKMSKLSASKTSIKKNKYIYVSGNLYRWSTAKNGYGAFGGQSVRIIFRFKGKKTWYHVKWVKTDRKGHYSAKVRAYGDGYFAAVFAGTSDTWSAGTPNDRYVNTYAVPSPGQRSGPAPIVDVRPWRG